MAYGTPSRPRFWIDAISLARSLNMLESCSHSRLFNMQPDIRNSLFFTEEEAEETSWKRTWVRFKDPRFVHACNFYGILNHSLSDEMLSYSVSACNYKKGLERTHQNGSEGDYLDFNWNDDFVNPQLP